MPDKQTEKIRKRYSRIAGIYDFVEKPMESMFAKWRQELMEEVEGKVLEVGVGTGKNLPYYPDDVDLIAIDFSPNMIEKARQRAAELNREVDLRLMDAQDMNFTHKYLKI